MYNSGIINNQYIYYSIRSFIEIRVYVSLQNLLNAYIWISMYHMNVKKHKTKK